MAPALLADTYFPRKLHFLAARATSDPNNPPLASVFALIIDRANYLASSSSSIITRSLAKRNTSKSSAAIQHISLAKRQGTNQVLVIPTTYANLNNSPAPGAVVGITLGAVLGFLLALFLLLWIFRLSGYSASETILEEEVIHRHSHSRSKHSATSSSSASVAVPPPAVMEEIRRESRNSRRESRRTSHVSRRTSHRPPPQDEVIVEEELSEASHEPDHVVVEEEESDIVEVIEEHSPEPPSRRKPSGRSGHFRTVDPAQYGGGDAPSRRISRASRHN